MIKDRVSNHGNATHGLSKSGLYRTYRQIIRRCYNKNSKSYPDYGGRGIVMCKEWRISFMAFYEWALISGYCKGLTIERVNNNKNYEPFNCKWITKSLQSRNRRSNHPVTFNGQTKLIVEWAEEYGISYRLLYKRLRMGWPLQKSLNTNTVSLKKKIIQKDILDNVIKIWDSQADIERGLGFNQTDISRCCIGQSKSGISHGFKWEFA